MPGLWAKYFSDTDFAFINLVGENEVGTLEHFSPAPGQGSVSTTTWTGLLKPEHTGWYNLSMCCHRDCYAHFDNRLVMADRSSSDDYDLENEEIYLTAVRLTLSSMVSLT